MRDLSFATSGAYKRGYNVMAEEEERAEWQHTANRDYFSQEDARRAPKISHSPSSSSSKSESDVAPDNAGRGLDHPSPIDKPYSDPPITMKWWLNPQPNLGRHKDFTYEQLNVLEADLEVLSSDFVNKTPKISDSDQMKKEFCYQFVIKNNDSSSVEKPWQVTATCVKNEHDPGKPELKAVTGYQLQRNTNKKDLGEFWYLEDKFMGLDSFNCLVPEQAMKLSSDLGSDWVGSEKTEPWWRSAGQDELASLVAQKSLENIENCDLPRPQAKHFRKGPSARTECFDHDGVSASSNQMVDTDFSNLEKYNCESLTTDLSLQNLDQAFSHSTGNSTTKDEIDNDPSKIELLEALCHSQTRAREAEEAARQAYADKEHIIMLFFRQASQLFAYKQWFHLLQIENLCLQLKNKNQPISSLFPDVLPWVPHKGRQVRKARHKAGKRKRSKQRSEIRKCAVAFAVGLGLASAGLLLGWTMGWLFPRL
ncbi:hypothetical protein I3843_05G176800 [Carya illinoinensis]|nr:hypothetical protein I3843_05G176800 [Carya illinoinensis]KAG7980317.1 hypothetical protein I3843_05G176800 [Carya illinoinensis]KAG7980318.1 hypothetical protein I3843_05G176800 [Carya illinoinensis]KAG7980319.1 hypothetical protein I3843_05G176800 [Carya illinoinensis]KAG7980320.1 hypothetical protein I3843_05G176800 [Carya illinoinensis]